MNDYEKTIKDLQDRVRALELLLQPKGCATKPNPKKWSPVGGDWWVKGEGDVVEALQSPLAKEFGTERPTQQQAERAAVEMRRFNRLLALRDELCGDEVRHVYEISFDTEDKKWVASDIGCFKAVTVGFEQERHAQRACDMLNSGEVEL